MRDERKWWEYKGHEIAVAMAIGFVFGLALKFLCGCSSLPVSEPAYPEYDKWWSGPEPRRSTNLSELGQGDILVFDNGQEAVLL